MQAAEALDKNVIGAVHDMTMGNYWKPERHTATQFLAKHLDDYTVAEDGWIIVRSKEHLWRAPRSKARELLGGHVACGRHYRRLSGGMGGFLS